MMENKRKMISIVVGLIVVFSPAICDQNPDERYSKFDPSKDMCKKCECTSHSTSFALNCAKKPNSDQTLIHHTPSNWPVPNGTVIEKFSVSFSGNQITTLESFPTINCTTMIALDYCSIKFLAPGLFENMKKITYVDLSHNLLTSEQVSSEKFKGPFNKDSYEPIDLVHLNLAYNSIHTLSKNVFDHLPYLKILNLEGNDLAILDLQTQAALSTIPNLERLNLADNGLTDIPEKTFENLKNLAELNLSKNKLKIVPRALAHAGSLRIFIFDSNPIFELSSETFNVIPNVVELSLNNLSNVVEIHPETFAPLKVLSKLELRNNKDLEIFESESFSNGQPIKELYINNNGLIDIPFDLLDWTKLTVFELNDNPLMCTCDLYKIRTNLSSRITMTKSGPYCIGYDENSYEVFSLDNTVCENNYTPGFSFKHILQKKVSKVRIALITMTLVALSAVIIAALTCYIKQKKYGMLDLKQFRSTTVLYNPLNSQPI